MSAIYYADNEDSEAIFEHKINISVENKKLDAYSGFNSDEEKTKKPNILLLEILQEQGKDIKNIKEFYSLETKKI